MKRLLLSVIMLGCVLGIGAQDAVMFEFSDGINNAALKSKMEQQVMNLLTAINKAESANGDINYSGIDLDDMASQSINALWANVHFRCLDDDIVEHCLELKNSKGTVRGYQVRNIAVEMKPFDESYTDDLNQEVCIDFDKSGRISDFNITMGIQQYTKLMKEGVDLDDVDRRSQIIHFCEQFRNAYTKKDSDFMETIFSDDALIITGRVITKGTPEVGLRKEVAYSVQGKEQYLNNLRKIFRNPKTGHINVAFDDYRIMRHGAKPNYYGVTLKQKWSSGTYSDEGIVFLVWDFTDENSPKIQVRTWQPMETEEKEIFTLNKFKLR